MKRVISAAAKRFIESQEVAVLSTLSRDNEVQGATVYYLFEDDSFYVLTKSESSKAHNMLANHQVALTIYDANQAKTVQLSGVARIESDQEMKRYVFDELTRARNYSGDSLMPPVTQLHAGGFIAFCITPTRALYVDYNDKTALIPSKRHYA